jgi:YD repeat-containing protein
MGLLGLVNDFVNGTNTRYTYDLAGRLVGMRNTYGTDASSGTLKVSASYTYDDNTNRLTGYSYNIAPNALGTMAAQTAAFTYGSAAAGQNPDAVYGVTWNGAQRLSYEYDGLGRRTSRTVNMGGGYTQRTGYTYVTDTVTKKTSTALDTVDNGRQYFIYTYDNDGNIIDVSTTINGLTRSTTYVYDGLGQLKRENNQTNNQTILHNYDANGNLTKTEVYMYSTATPPGTTRLATVDYGYTSVWKDLLTSYAGTTITYDAMGNPLNYRSGMTMTWQNGRRMASATNGGTTTSYMYNENGIRTQKTVGSTATYYELDGSTIIAERSTGKNIAYMFDENGTRFGLIYNNVYHYYLFNGQGDVTGIVDASGAVECYYRYNA